LFLARVGALPAQAPPFGPATVTVTGDRVVIEYEGRRILEGTLGGRTATTEFVLLTDTVQGAIAQVAKWTARGGQPITLSATVVGSAEAFPVEADRREDGVRLVRTSVGLSHSLLNRAVYDRSRDWLLSVDHLARVTVTPTDSAARGLVFRLEARGWEIALRFRPHFYRTHRGLTAFAPWTYRPRQASVAGWTSWFAFRDSVTEADVRTTAAVVAAKLAPWGYTVIQIDDGFQQSPIGVPDHWLRANAKFPAGLPALARSIADLGLVPGIWTNTAFHDRTWAQAHPAYFVRAADGRPAWGNWVGFVMDGANPATLDSLVRPVYRGLRATGWRYFKVDALRHLRYEGYNSFRDDYRARGLDRDSVFRGVVRAVREEIGPDAYLLACWGVRPELVGLVDAVRVGTDGFGFAGFAQYNSYNNVVWRNDPDHIELAQPDGIAAVMATSLTGSLLMLTDRPGVYETARVEAARRAAPVLFALPGQVYDVDPSRSSQIHRAATEVSGAGVRPFDAEQRPSVHLYLLEVNRPFERWVVLGRTGGEDLTLDFPALGLEAERDYLVFEFWTRSFRGVRRERFATGPVDSAVGAQLFCIRERLPRPQIVATSRHVSCGGYDLEDVRWDGRRLTGVSRLVADDPYVVHLTEPEGWSVEDVAAEGADVTANAMDGELRAIRLVSRRGGLVTWTVRYRTR
jgi:alpha-galactosidase